MNNTKDELKARIKAAFTNLDIKSAGNTCRIFCCFVAIVKNQLIFLIFNISRYVHIIMVNISNKV